MSMLFKNGRLKSSRRDVIQFISSIKDDEKLLKHVIEINEAHIVMLIEQGIMEIKQGAKLLKALEKLKSSAKIKHCSEDIHVYVEEEVVKTAGKIGENLHIAKSRNDQVATAIRMALRKELTELMKFILEFQESLLKKAEKHVETIIPGYTHLRPAQPITFSHYLLYQFDVFQRNLQRLIECYARVNCCPMGAAALATTSFPISRERVAELLGFDALLENSIDAVGTRDFVLESLGILSIIAVDITRLVEDLIIWSTPEFDLIELPDEFCSTSSIMPQKKNPDVLEIIRARMSHIIGNFTACALTLKSLPSSYNLDFQEVTPKMWESFQKVKKALSILSDLIMLCNPKEQNVENSILTFSTLTELVKIIFQKYGVPFRTAHKIVGAFVRQLEKKKVTINDATPEMLGEIIKNIANKPIEISINDLKTTVDVIGFIKAHRIRGGPSPSEVQRMLNSRRDFLASMKKQIAETEMKITNAQRKLDEIISKIMQNTIAEKFKKNGVEAC